MFPGEMVVLMAIAVTKDSGEEILIRPMDVASEYIAYLYNSLVRRGYLKGKGSRGYQLTSKGRRALFEFLHENETRVRGVIRTLQQLGIEIGGGANKTAKRAIEVK